MVPVNMVELESAWGGKQKAMLELGRELQLIDCVSVVHPGDDRNVWMATFVSFVMRELQKRHMR